MLILLGFSIFWFLFWIVDSYKTLIIFALGVAFAKFYFDGSEKNRKRRWDWFQECMSRFVHFTKQQGWVDYDIVFHDGAEKEYEVYLTGERSAIFAASPHGTISIGSFYHAMCNKKWWRGVTLCVHHLDFAIPFLREFSLWCGMMDVSRENIIHSLEKDQSVYVVIGGTREMMSSSIDTVHRGLLQIAYEKKKVVFPVLHRGQENIIKCYTTEWLDHYVRRPFLGWTGYAFPSFFLPQKGKMTTHIFPAIDPSEKFIEASHFIDYYYQMIKKYEFQLIESEAKK